MIINKDISAIRKTAENLLNSSFISKLPVSDRSKELLAFTLAEVLITLLIIGIVASLVIPGLIADTQEAELHTAWKKAFADFSQATKLIIVDNGGTLKGLFANATTLRNYYAPYLNYTKLCNDAQTLGNCWHKNNGSVKYLSGVPVTTDWPNSGTGFILSNGNLVWFVMRSKDCDYPTGNLMVCATGHVDVNGFKGPNIVGKDIYGFKILENRIVPYGILGDDSNYYPAINDCSNPPNTSSGWGCSTLYLN